MNPDAIPDVLRQRDAWVVWAIEQRDGKATKVPRQPADSDRRADVPNEPIHRTSFETALEAYRERDDLEGIGFVFDDGDLTVGVDLDDCRDPETGELEPWAEEIVEQLDSYTEVSPSGTGLHVYALGAKPGDRCRSGGVEMYDNDRFFTVTGDHLEGIPTTVETRPEALKAVYRDHLEPDTDQEPSADVEPPGGVDLDDAALLKKARDADNGDRFSRLWDGDTSMHDGDHSRADMALLCHLAFWTGGDRARMERLFGRSGLARDKWHDRPDYRERSIDAALEQTTEFYEPSERADRVAVNGGAAAEGPVSGGPEGPERPPEPGGDDKDDLNPTAYFDDDGLFKAYSFASDLLDVNTDRQGRPLFATDIRTETLYHHDGRHWTPRGEQVIRRKTREVLRNAASAKRVNEVVKNAKIQTYQERNEIIDLPPERLVVRNGVVDLVEGEFSPELDRPGTLSWLDVEYDEDAHPERFNSFLFDILRPEDVSIMWEVIGLCLYRGYPFQRAIMLLGEGANGKSTLLAALRDFLGPENVASLELRDLSRRFGAAELEGKLANLAPDIADDDLERTSTFKALTGGDEITADRKHKTPVRFKNAATLLFSANRPPSAEDETYGYERRWLYFKFPRRFDENDDETVPQKELLESFREEQPGILNMAIESFRDLWERGGFEATTYMEKHGEAVHKRATRPVVEFVQDEITRTEGAKLRRKVAYNAYENWANEHDHTVQGKEMFFRHVRREYSAEVVTDPSDNRYKIWLDLRLVDGDAEEQTTIS